MGRGGSGTGTTTVLRGAEGAEVAPGMRRPSDPRVWGPIIGAVGASVFVHANRSQLPDAASTGAAVLWVGASGAFVWAVFLAPRLFSPLRPLPRSAGWVYLASVAGMIAAIQAGRWVLDRLDETDLVPAVIVLAVGVHFLPFARAFRTPVFTRLGVVMTLLGVVGLGLGLAWTSTAVAVAAVVTGMVMLVVMTEDALRTRAGGRQRT